MKIEVIICPEIWNKNSVDWWEGDDNWQAQVFVVNKHCHKNKMLKVQNKEARCTFHARNWSDYIAIFHAILHSLIHITSSSSPSILLSLSLSNKNFPFPSFLHFPLPKLFKPRDPFTIWGFPFSYFNKPINQPIPYAKLGRSVLLCFSLFHWKVDQKWKKFASLALSRKTHFPLCFLRNFLSF